MIYGYTKYGNHEIAQSAIYGVGLLVKRIQPAEFRPFLPELLQVIGEYLQTNSAKGSGRDIQNCRDNFVSTLGKCLKCMWEIIDVEHRKNVFDMLLKNLPLKQDKQEGLEMHCLLAELVQT